MIRNEKNVKPTLAFPNLIESEALPWTLKILIPATYSIQFTRLCNWFKSLIVKPEIGEES